MFTLSNKVAVVFAASGEISSAVATSFAEQGARVFLSARREAPLAELASKIRQAGGKAETAVVDATDEKAVKNYFDTVVKQTNQIDIVFNGIGLRPEPSGYCQPTTEISYEQFMLPIRTMLGSQFITSRAAVRKMIATNHPGTILLLTASLSRLKMPMMSGLTAACTGIEGLTRSMAAEFGRFGIRVTCLNPTAIQETQTIQETSALNAAQLGITPEVLRASMEQNNLLGRGPNLKNIGDFTAFLASDAGSILNSHIVDADYGNAAVI
ncbi:MAG: SDR family oxidoreductase [Bacteroidota bacterium]